MDQNILEFFKRAIGNNKLAHGYLFYGPAAAGKKDTAFWLADFLKTSPFDILYIVPEQGKKDISINQIRKAKRHLSLSPYNSQYKFAIIDRAELMNAEASNALLKTLEEPQGNTILILITTKPDLLLKTIYSRLQDVKFKGIPLSQVSKEFLNKKYTDIFGKSLNDIFEFIERVAKNSKEKKDDTEIFSLLDNWLFWFREKMLNDNKHAAAVKEIQKTIDLISTTNINKRLALENLVLCIKS